MKDKQRWEEVAVFHIYTRWHTLRSKGNNILLRSWVSISLTKKNTFSWVPGWTSIVFVHHLFPHFLAASANAKETITILTVSDRLERPFNVFVSVLFCFFSFQCFKSVKSNQIWGRIKTETGQKTHWMTEVRWHEDKRNAGKRRVSGRRKFREVTGREKQKEAEAEGTFLFPALILKKRNTTGEKKGRQASSVLLYSVPKEE